MPTKTHTTAVVLIPPESIQQPIQDIRKIHDRNYIRWMPHITMLYPFAPQPEFPEIIPALEQTAEETTSFTVTFSSFNAFKHRKTSTMFLTPEPDDNIKKLHKTLISHLPDYDDTARFPNGFTPTYQSDNSNTKHSHKKNNDCKQIGNLSSLKLIRYI